MELPTKEDIEKFLKPLYENKKEYNENAAWLQEYKTSVNNITEATYSEITTNEIESATSEFSNWKSPRLDKLHNFWWNKLTTLHPKVAVAFEKLIFQPENCPDWLTTGQTQTTLITKKEPTRNPSNYRPITCLPVMYKILSSFVTSQMSHHVDTNKIIPNKQKGNASNTYGTMDLLIINKMVMDNVKLKQRNISTAWIDYKKTFGSVPHNWIIETLKIHKFDLITTKFLRKTMNKWKTSLHLNHRDGQIKTDHFSIKTGIFQGDSPSGLLFILSLLPLSWLLNTSNIGYRISCQVDIISHLLFMDDLKLFAANNNQLASMIRIANKFSDGIGMCFGLTNVKSSPFHMEKLFIWKTSNSIMVKN